MTRAALIRIIASYELALGAEEKFPALRGYAEHYLKSLDQPALKLLSQYNKMRKEIAADVAARIEAMPHPT